MARARKKLKVIGAIGLAGQLLVNVIASVKEAVDPVLVLKKTFFFNGYSPCS